jgi:hypothetical protein
MNKEDIKKVAKMIAETEPRSQTSIKNDIINWSYYNNTPNKKKYEYLIQRGDARLPMYTVHIPCQRPICDTLISQQARRTWQFSVVATDKESVRSKWEAKQKAFINAKKELYKQKLDEYNDNIFQIQQQIQQIEQMLQTEPQSQEEAEQIMQLKQQYPMIKREFDKILRQFYEEIDISEKTKKDIEHYYSYTYKDLREVISEKLMIKMRKQYEIKAKSIESMRQNIVIGKEAYLVYCDEKTNELNYEVLDRINVKYPIIKGVKYIQDCPWVSVVDSLSSESIKQVYGEQLKELGIDLDKELVDNKNAVSEGTFVSVPGHGAVFTGSLDDTEKAYREDGIQRERIWFKKTKEVKFKVSKNKKENALVKEFIHMIPLTKELLDKNKYKYTKIEIDGKTHEYYVNKKDKKDVYNVSDCELYDPEKEKVITRYTMDRYSCTIINNMWVVDVSRDIKLNRKRDKHSKFNLPVFGKTYNSITDQPYSIIKNTIDLQDLYNGIYMLRQLAYAIAGAKGQIMDKSQKPEGMSMDEWEANISQGRMYIQTIDASGKKINNSFNQWNSFDNTVSNSVQYYDNVLMQIKETMGEIVGVPRQRQGEIIKGDLVGNTEIALQQAHLITEILYEEHDEVEAKALNELLMLYIKYQPIDNTFLEFNDRTEGRDIFYLEQGMFRDIDLELVVENSNKEQQNLEMFKQILQAEYSRGSINANDLAELIPIESITEMKKKTDHIMKKNQELAMQNQSQAIQEQKESQKEIEQFKVQLQIQAQEHANLIAEKQMEIASFIAQSKAQVDQQNVLMKQYIEDKKHEREMIKISNEDKVEMSYLQEQSRSATVQQKLSALQIQLDAMFNTLKYGLDKKGLEFGHVENVKKLNVEDKKATAMEKKSPEHISDK